MSTGRWAISRRTGRSPQFPYLALLTGEYLATGATSHGANLLAGRTLTTRPAGNGCLAGAQVIAIMPMYPYQNQPNTFVGGLDDAAFLFEFTPSLGVGPITLGSSVNHDYALTYYRLRSATCGSKANFATLLPNRAAAAAAAMLHPNPATEATTLTLLAPAQPGAALVLTDALGRRVWSAAVAAGQTTVLVPLTE